MAAEKRGAHDWPQFPAMQFTVGAGAAVAKRIQVPVRGANVFQLPRLMSNEECAKLTATAESMGMQSVSWEYAKEYRDCQRLVCMSDELATLLWHRIRGALKREDIAGVRPYGFDNEGDWMPIGVNPCMRFTRYDKGGHFRPHKDGAFVLESEVRSVYTLQIYLNGGFPDPNGLPATYTDGETVFFEDIPPPQPVELERSYAFDYRNHDGTMTPPHYPAAKKAASVRGRTGTMLIFNHDAMHEGAPVTKGTKYILRTDLMFRRIAPFWVCRNMDAMHPMVAKAENLYQKSIELQKNGRPAESTQMYLQAQEIQARLPSIQESIGLPFALPVELNIAIFSYLTLKDLMIAARVNRCWRALSKDGGLWKPLFRTRFGTSGALVVNEVDVEPNDIVYKDWYRAYVDRSFLEEHFKIMIIDLGAHSTKYRMAGRPLPRTADKYGDYMTDDVDRSVNPIVRSFVRQVKGHYWSSYSSVENFIIGNNFYYARYELYGMDYPYQIAVGKRKGWPKPEEYYWIASKYEPTIHMDGQIQCNWETFRTLMKYIFYGGFHGFQLSPQHPVLFCEPAWFTDEERRHVRTILGQMQVPCAAFVPAPVLALASEGVKTGLCVMLGGLFTQVVPVVNGIVIRSGQRFFPVAAGGLDKEGKEQTDPAQYFQEAPERNLPAIAHAAIAACPPEHHAQLYKSVVLAGGYAEPVMVTRFTQAFVPGVPAGTECHVTVTSDRNFDVVNGGLNFATIPNIREYFDPIQAVEVLPPWMRRNT